MPRVNGSGGRGIPLGAAPDSAYLRAARIVDSYRGMPPLPPEECNFARSLVLDALPAAPQPITYAWVRHSLALVGNFTRWASGEGLPLDRGYLLTRHNVDRWIQVALAGRPASGRATYRARLEVIASFVQPDEWGGQRSRIDKSGPSLPLTKQEIADAWLWASHLPVPTHRHRMTASLALCLGCGLAKGEEGTVRREDLTRDRSGVHVTVGTGQLATRSVTCRREWEERLWEVAHAVPPHHLVTCPWRTSPQTKNSYSQMLARMKGHYPPPVDISHHRMRVTWIAQHMLDGTPLPIILAGAGLSSPQTLYRLLPVLPPFSAAEESTWLRGRP